MNQKQRIPRGTRGHLFVDWVELGCRGWDIDASGAELANAEACCPDSDHAHIDRTTLHLLVFGCRCFYARVQNDLVAGGIMKYVKKPQPQPILVEFDGLLVTAGTTANNVVGVPPNAWRVVEQTWTHPSGASITINPAEKKSWWQQVRDIYQARIAMRIATWFNVAERVGKAA